MRHLLNTLFVTSEDAYLTLDGENIVVKREQTRGWPVPTAQSLRYCLLFLCWCVSGADGSLCQAECGPELLYAPGKVSGPDGGDFRWKCAASPGAIPGGRRSLRSCQVAKYMIFGKVYNSRWSIERTRRDHKPRIDQEKFQNAAAVLKNFLPQLLEECSMDSLRGLEGAAATVYFDVFDDMILREKEAFFFHGRNRRPPLDNVNAMLSFAYSLLTNDCASALEAVGLDSYVGFLHRDRPGRTSLALDLMEELRPCFADRFVLTMINNRVMQPSDFEQAEDGAVRMTDDARRKFLKSWQERKQETITHPYLGEKMPWGLVPYMQALLLSRFLRGDLDDYPPFLWK